MARMDQGGLASQTYEVWRALRPERVLVVDMGDQSRGAHGDPSQFAAPWCETFMTHHRPRQGFEIDRFLAGLDVCFMVETAYTDHVYTLARGHGCATVLHLNPELFGAQERQATELWAPTDWRLERLPLRTTVVPMPVALDRFEYRQRTKADVFFSTTGEAMCDRNGWDVVRAAMALMDRPAKFLFRGGPEPNRTRGQLGKATIEWLPPVDDYAKVIPAEADVLVMPRRYGGLCLPMAEASAQGVPTVMTLLSPQTRWIPHDLLVPTCGSRPVKMKGGTFPVHDVRPADLAARLNMLMDSPTRVAIASYGARQWAEGRSWETQLPVWREHFARLAG